MSKRALIVAVLVTAGVGALLLWGLLDAKEGSDQRIRIGYLPIAPDASFFVALERGFFEDQGLLIEPVKFATSNQVLEALVSERIDATAIVALEAALALEANAPGEFRIVEMTAATEGTRVHRIVVKNDSDIKELADLRGKHVGTFPGSQMVVFLKLVLERYFDPESELRITQLKPPLQPQALQSGQVDAVFCLEPMGTLLEMRGIGRAISVNPLYEHIQKPFPTAVSVVSARLAKSAPETVAAIVRALDAAHDFMRSEPDRAREALVKYSPIDIEIAAEVGLYDYWGLSEIDRAAVQQLADLFFEKGVLPRRVSVDQLYVSDGK